MTNSTVKGKSADYGSLSVEELVSRLCEAEETLDAIRAGEVDAVVVGGPAGQRVYTLENADRPYRVLVEQMQEGAITLAEDGTVLYCNERFATLAGKAHDSIIGQPISMFFSVHENTKICEMIELAIGRGVADELTLISQKGARVPVNMSLIDLRVDVEIPRLICGIVTDLTSSRMRAHELGAANQRLAAEIVERRRTEENLQLTLDAAEMGIWELDLVTNQMRCSARHDQIIGLATHRSFFDFGELIDNFVSDDRGKVVEAFSRAKTTGNIEFEHRIRRVTDGALRWVNVKGRTYYDGSQPIRITGVTADITQRREVDEQLRQAQKMEAVGQLTGGIAHDFNNLLMIIGGSLDMLGRRMAEDPKVRLLFDAAQQAVGRGAKLNQQLLAFSRRQDFAD